MALILNIDTAVQAASVCLADDEDILGVANNSSEKESAQWLHTAIKNLLQEKGCDLQEIQTIAVSAGPGSYTGLRIGMSTAKGLCYSLSKPLITINTLQMMASAANNSSTKLLCPMIDARRMEVFTALYDTALKEMMSSRNMILDPTSLHEWLANYSISFFGNGSEKARLVISHPNAVFSTVNSSAKNMVSLSAQKFKDRKFSDLAYAEPLYCKDFHSPISKKNY